MSETVNHPPHYGGDTPYEAIKVIEAWGLGFHLGNTVKYIARADAKGKPVEDLKKARWYLDREIEKRTRRAFKREQSLQIPKEAANSNASKEPVVRLRDLREVLEQGCNEALLGTVGKE